MVSTARTISALSDEKALSLFKAIALSENDYSSILITKLRLTRRQYCSITKGLMDAGLVKRISGKYSLTSFGKIMFGTYVKIETAIQYYWRLKAVDSILMSANAELPPEECQSIIDNLIDNNEIKAVLVSNNICESQSYSSSEQREQQRQTRQLKDLLMH
jgi:predicted transcriptional regulator